jgi:hypothetical protein
VEIIQLHGLRFSLQNLSWRTLLNWLCLVLITSQHRPYRKHSSSSVAPRLVIEEMCLLRRCMATAVAPTAGNTVLILFCACMLRALPSNVRCLQAISLVTSLRVILLPPSGYSSPTAISSLPKGVLVMSVIGLTFLPAARFSWWLLSNRSHCSLLKAVRPEWFPHRVPVGPGVSASSSDRCGQNFREWSMLLLMLLLLLMVSSSVSEGADPSTMSSHSLPASCWKFR